MGNEEILFGKRKLFFPIAPFSYSENYRFIIRKERAIKVSEMFS